MVDRSYLPEVISYLRTRYQDIAWAELDEVVNLFVDTATLDWWLPLSACLSLNTAPSQGLPASAALLASQASIILVDDILDKDPKGIHNKLGVGEASNLAVALESLAFECLLSAPISATHQVGALHALSRMFTTTAFGQAADVSEITSEQEYWSVVRDKSTPFYGLALELGALMSEGPPGTVKSFYELGVLVGEIVQLHDDLYDALDTPAKPDWQRRSNNLLILYGSTVDHDEKEEFLEKVDRAGDDEILQYLQKVLVRSGALSYCTYQLTLRHNRCLELVKNMDLPDPEPIHQLVREQVRPVMAILESSGAELPPEIAVYD